MACNVLALRRPQALIAILVGLFCLCYSIFMTFSCQENFGARLLILSRRSSPVSGAALEGGGGGGADQDRVMGFWRYQIYKELSGYSNITYEGLQQAEQTLKRSGEYGIRVTIIDGRMFFKVIPTDDKELHAELQRSGLHRSFFGYTMSIMTGLRMLVNDLLVENVVFNLRFGDGCVDLDWEGVDTKQDISALSFPPVFSYTRGTGSPVACPDVTFPGMYWMLPSGHDSLPGSLRFDSYTPVPWEQRKDVVFFRGDLNSWDDARIHMLFASLKYPDLIDAKLVHIEEAQCQRILEAAALQTPLVELSADCKEVLGDYITTEQAIHYKYMLNIDGHGISARHKHTMAGNFVLFKIYSEYEQFYYSSLEPWVHYVPVSRENLAEDLMKRVTWARAHDKECQKIAGAAVEFAKEYLTLEKLHWYQAEVLHEYSKKLDFQPFIEDGAHEFCCSQLQNLPEGSPTVDFAQFLIPHCVDLTECIEENRHEYLYIL